MNKSLTQEKNYKTLREELSQNKKHCDLKIKVNEKTYEGHKVIYLQWYVY